MVFGLSSWRESFEIVSQELALAKKKKQALDQLLANKRMSQPTYYHLENALTASISDLETHQRSLAHKMDSRIDELEEQIPLLEWVLADLEIRRVGEEVGEEIYAKRKERVMQGLDATKTELNEIRTSLAKIRS